MIPINVKVTGEFTVTVSDAVSGEIKEQRKFKNLITNAGLDRIGQWVPGNSSTAGMLDYLMVSTSTTAPSITDTAMGGTAIYSITSSPIYATGGTAGTSPDFVYTYSVGRRWAAGTATGTWSMVGIGWDVSGTKTVFAKTRIKDGGGNDSSITVTASEVLDVRYQIRITPALAETSGSVTISGTSYNWTRRSYDVHSPESSGGIMAAKQLGMDFYSGQCTAQIYAPVGANAITHGAANTSGPSNLTYSATSGACGLSSYVPGSKTRDLTFTFSTSANVTGDRVCAIGLPPTGMFAKQVFVINAGTVATGIPKTNLDNMTLTFQYSWDRS